jgi:phage-related holin
MDHFLTVFFQARDILASVISHWVVKGIAASLISLAAMMLGPENYRLLLVLGLLVVIDLITGMVAAVSRGEPLESRKVFKTATKSFVYILFFSSAYLTHTIVPFSDFITIGVLSFLGLTEFLSVIENMAKMGYILPQKLLNQIKSRAMLDTKSPDVFGNGN